MLEPYLIGHCSPTLANLKTANLFGYRYDRTEDLTEQLEQLRQQLLPRGVELRLLQLGPDRALVYVYRIRRLVRDLADPEIRQFLQGCGYRDFSAEGALAHLARRIAENGGEFPHEIGLFLGYPVEDVIGFIDNEGENFLCSGCWKVYAKERDAQTCFCCYKNCTTMYQQLFDEGVSIECLAAVDEDFPAAEAFRAAG